MKIKFLTINRLIDSKWLLSAIIILAALLRLWKLESIPPGLTPDEASLGYNAYSILKTGRDEYGKFLPIIFKSFGDYKPGLYVYTTVPFVVFLGLNEWSVRLPSVLAGIISVWLIYKIVTELLSYELGVTGSKKFGILAAFMAAINPWLIYFSRGAWEANLSLALTLTGIYFFLKSFSKVKYLTGITGQASLILSSLFLSLTLVTYQGAKLSTAIVVAILFYVYRFEVKKILKVDFVTVIKSAVVGTVIIIPIIISLFQGKTGRLEVFSVFSYPRPKEYTQTFLDQGGEKLGSINYYLFHSEALNFKRGILGRWFNHFSGKFLFFEGDYQNPMHSAPNHGMLLMIDLILIPLGFISLIRRKSNFSTFFIVWLIFSPLPAVLSRDQVQAVRALNTAVPLIIFSASGLALLFDFIVKVRSAGLRYASFCFLTLLLFSSVTYFVDSYFIHLPVHNAKNWMFGYRQAVEKISVIKNNYDNIIFQQSYSQPYIYFLFFKKYDPAMYQKQSHLTEGGVDVGLVEKLDNIDFEFYSWPPAINNKKTLVVGDPVAIPPDFSTNDFKLISEIKYPDGILTAFRILETRNND